MGSDQNLEELSMIDSSNLWISSDYELVSVTSSNPGKIGDLSSCECDVVVDSRAKPSLGIPSA